MRRAACVLWLLAVAAPASAQPATAVEYFHAAFGHYFITAGASEIAALDGGSVAGWTRTGETFAVDGSESVCRFFTARFGGKASHFYTPYASECGSLRAADVWTYEGTVFRLDVPAANGACRSGTRPLYRLYNDGRGGAPNHRYTVRSNVAAQMRGQGWQQEGTGLDPVFACVPAAGGTPPVSPGGGDLRGTIRIAAGVRQLGPEWTARVQAQSATEVVFTQSPGLAVGEVFVVPDVGAFRATVLADGGRRVAVSPAGVDDLFDELEIEGTVALTADSAVVAEGAKGVGVTSLITPRPEFYVHTLDGQLGVRTDFKLKALCEGQPFELVDVNLGIYGTPSIVASKSRQQYEISGARVVAEASAQLGCKFTGGMERDAIWKTLPIRTGLAGVSLYLNVGGKFNVSTDVLPALELARAKIDGTIDINRTPVFVGTHEGSGADSDSIFRTLEALPGVSLSGTISPRFTARLDLAVDLLAWRANLVSLIVRTGPDLTARFVYPFQGRSKVCGDFKWMIEVSGWDALMGEPLGDVERPIFKHAQPMATGWAGLVDCDMTGWLFTLESCSTGAIPPNFPPCATCPPIGSSMIVPYTMLDEGRAIRLDFPASSDFPSVVLPRTFPDVPNVFGATITESESVRRFVNFITFDALPGQLTSHLNLTKQVWRGAPPICMAQSAWRGRLF